MEESTVKTILTVLTFVAVVSGARSPPPANVFTGFVVGPDPQVAAGTTHLVTANTGDLAFWDKATLTQLPGHYDSAYSLFSSLLPKINPGKLNFPPADTIACKPNDIFRPFNPSDPLGTVQGCVNEFYDTRILFDKANGRFWIEAHGGNQIWHARSAASYREAKRIPRWTRRRPAIHNSRTWRAASSSWLFRKPRTPPATITNMC
jgi:hypothetical protein